MKCIIPCAGLSSRMNYIPKHLVKVQNKPLIQYVIDTWTNVCDTFVFVIHPSMGYMLEHLPKDSIFVMQEEPLGLANAILRTERIFGRKERFVIALGDCIHRGTFEITKCRLGIGVWVTSDADELKKSYSVEVDSVGAIKTLIEKPKNLDVGNCGMGTYFMDSRVFKYIESTPVAPGGGDFTLILQHMILSGEEIKPIWFKGSYVNVGSPEDLAKAEKILK